MFGQLKRFFCIFHVCCEIPYQLMLLANKQYIGVESDNIEQMYLKQCTVGRRHTNLNPRETITRLSRKIQESFTLFDSTLHNYMSSFVTNRVTNVLRRFFILSVVISLIAKSIRCHITRREKFYNSPFVCQELCAFRSFISSLILCSIDFI